MFVDTHAVLNLNTCDRRLLKQSLKLFIKSETGHLENLVKPENIALTKDDIAHAQQLLKLLDEWEGSS